MSYPRAAAARGSSSHATTIPLPPAKVATSRQSCFTLRLAAIFAALAAFAVYSINILATTKQQISRPMNRQSRIDNSETRTATPVSLLVAPRSPLQHFADSICCAQRWVSVSKEKRERKCSHRGRFRRTATRGPVVQMAVSMTASVAKPTFAEFGVELADSVEDFAYALREHASPVTVHLFDNFERGLPAASKMDHSAAMGRAGKFAGTAENAKERWGKQGFVPVLHKGLFDDSLFGQPVPRDLVTVHSDGDLYVSINHVLIQTYRHVAFGGAIIIDDWYGGHSGVWEAARKAVYDFAIHEGVAPRLQTPVAGASAYWYKMDSDSCADCYPGVQVSQINLNKLPARELSDHKQRLEAVIEAVSSFADCSTLEAGAVPQATDRHVFHRLLEWHGGRVDGDTAFVCNATKSQAFQAAGQKFASVRIGNNCSDAQYDQAILSWWKELPVGSAIFLECWEGSVADPTRGCRPAFYRFVQAQGIMPHLQTIYDHPVAFWIKGPSPLG